MNLFMVLPLFFTAALAASTIEQTLFPNGYTTKHHVDDDGQYTKEESGRFGPKEEDAVVSGRYSWIDAFETPQSIAYTSDKYGFAPKGNIGVPQQLLDAVTRLVAQAKEEHDAEIASRAAAAAAKEAVPLAYLRGPQMAKNTWTLRGRQAPERKQYLIKAPGQYFWSSN